MLSHVARPIQLIPRIQKIPVIALPDKLLKLALRQAFLIQIPRCKLNSKFEQETSRFAAGASSGLLVVHDFVRGHFLLFAN